jgi:hypothetical protein
MRMSFPLLTSPGTQGVVFSNDSVSVAPEFETMYDASCALWTRVRPRPCLRLPPGRMDRHSHHFTVTK